MKVTEGDKSPDYDYTHHYHANLIGGVYDGALVKFQHKGAMMLIDSIWLDGEELSEWFTSEQLEELESLLCPF